MCGSEYIEFDSGTVVTIECPIEYNDLAQI
jgi:hypothetical protein